MILKISEEIVFSIVKQHCVDNPSMWCDCLVDRSSKGVEDNEDYKFQITRTSLNSVVKEWAERNAKITGWRVISTATGSGQYTDYCYGATIHFEKLQESD